MKPAPSLEDVAGAILDGTAVDWNVVESGTAESDQPLVSQLKALAALRLVSRRSAQTDDQVRLPSTLLGPGKPDTTSWGHLRVFEPIGHGAFGEVYRAWDTRLDREVALKLLPAVTSADVPESSVIEEGRLLARVRHPNVVTIYGAERIDGRIGLWMEFIKGRTLEESLKAGTTFTPKAATRLGIELCHAVAAVHSAGLLHRDIKAQNVMVTDDGRLVLMDFGTGRELDASDSVASAFRRKSANVAGTPLYLAPEVLSGSAATARSDVYSVGVVLYRLLAGAYPVQGRNLTELRRAHADRERQEKVRLKPDTTARIPRRIGRVISRALDPNPGRRYASANVLGEALLKAETLPRRVFFSAAAAALIASLAWTTWGFRAGALLAPGTVPASGAATSAAITSPAIAVLPFKNLSSEPDSDYFVDGLTSEVIRNLWGIDGLEVRSGTSSFFFKDKPRDLATIGREMKANLVVEGDVLRVGNRLRINAQLVQIAGDVPLWSETFDRKLDDVFAIHDEISRAIVNKLRLTLGKGQRRYQTNIAAYDLYLRGRTLVAHRGPAFEQGQEAAKLFEQAIAMDHAFAPAHAGLAEAYARMSWQIGGGLPLEEGLSGMRPAAMRALLLDPLLPEAHAAMGITYARERDWANATKSFERALELSPNLTHVQANYADSTLIPLGEAEKAEALLVAALKVDPLSLELKNDLAFAQFVAGHYDDAIANSRVVLAADPEASHQILARALLAAGRPLEAIAVWETRPATSGDWERWITRAYVEVGRRADVDRLVRAHRNERPFRRALIYAALRDTDRTFEELNRAVEDSPHRVAFTLACPEMAFLRDDPRLDALRKRLNLP